MSREPRVDRVRFHQKERAYFLDSPDAPFLVYDGSRQVPLQWELPENYAVYAGVSGIDTVVVKVSTSILAHDGYLRTIYNMNCLSEDLTRLKEDLGLNVLLVTSGAIGLGRKARLRRGERIPEKEKAAPEQKRLDAVEGQFLLYELWRHHFYPQLTGESLVTHDDIRNPQKRAKLLRTYQTWLSEGKIPVINEDDARSLEEIDIMQMGERVFGDNDGLGSLMACLLKSAGYSPLYVLLSNTDGIYTAESFRSGEYVPIRVVKNSLGLEEQAQPVSSSRGRGGMISKIVASREASDAGIGTIVANGQYCNHDAAFQERKPGSQRLYRVLDAALSGSVVGTRFLPQIKT